MFAFEICDCKISVVLSSEDFWKMTYVTMFISGLELSCRTISHIPVLSAIDEVLSLFMLWGYRRDLGGEGDETNWDFVPMLSGIDRSWI